MIFDLGTDQFGWVRETRTFVAERGMLGLTDDGPIPPVLRLRSHATGQRELFELEYIEEDGSLEYRARRASLCGVKVKVFTDMRDE